MHPRDLINAIKGMSPEDRDELRRLVLDTPASAHATPTTIRTIQAGSSPAAPDQPRPHDSQAGR